jgi:hypothetical protein
MGRRRRLSVDLRAENHLRETLSITEINEDNPPMISAGSNPAAQSDFTSNIRRAQGAAEAVTVVHRKIRG